MPTSPISLASYGPPGPRKRSASRKSSRRTARQWPIVRGATFPDALLRRQQIVSLPHLRLPLRRGDQARRIDGPRVDQLPEDRESLAEITIAAPLELLFEHGRALRATLFDQRRVVSDQEAIGAAHVGLQHVGHVAGSEQADQSTVRDRGQVIQTNFHTLADRRRRRTPFGQQQRTGNGQQPVVPIQRQRLGIGGMNEDRFATRDAILQIDIQRMNQRRLGRLHHAVEPRCHLHLEERHVVVIAATGRARVANRQRTTLESQLFGLTRLEERPAIGRRFARYPAATRRSRTSAGRP